MILNWKERVKPITVTGNKSNLSCILQNALIILKGKKKRTKTLGSNKSYIEIYLRFFFKSRLIMTV